MSARRESVEGRHVALYPTREELAAPSRVSLPEPARAPGLLLPNGDINWACPCLGSMAAGPCALPFRDAFSCFHYSTSEPKGSECYDKFSAMQQCLGRYPDLYGDEEVELPETDADPPASDNTDTQKDSNNK